MTAQLDTPRHVDYRSSQYLNETHSELHDEISAGTATDSPATPRPWRRGAGDCGGLKAVAVAGNF